MCATGESENVHYDPLHYLALLERKPNSLDFGKPFEAWKLPDAFAVLRRRLESDGDADGRREFIKVLRLLENHQVKELGDAIDRALEIGAMTVDVIKILVQEGRESPAKTLPARRPTASARPQHSRTATSASTAR